jgi:hypothetical protein
VSPRGKRKYYGSAFCFLKVQGSVAGTIFATLLLLLPALTDAGTATSPTTTTIAAAVNAPIANSNRPWRGSAICSLSLKYHPSHTTPSATLHPSI